MTVYENNRANHNELKDGTAMQYAGVIAALHNHHGYTLSGATELTLRSRYFAEMDDVSNLMWYEPLWKAYESVCAEAGIRPVENPSFACDESEIIHDAMAVFEGTRVNLGCLPSVLYGILGKNGFWDLMLSRKIPDTGKAIQRMSAEFERKFMSVHPEWRQPWFNTPEA